jgi:Uncharacterised nucleotidyltransferase
MTVARPKTVDALIEVCRFSLDRSRKPSFRTVDQEFMLAAIGNKAEGLVCAAAGDGVIEFSEDARVSLRQFEEFKKAKNAHSAASVLIAQSAMDGAGIDCVHFKGTVFQWLLYGNPFYRLSCDADILVDENDFRSAADALKSKGLKRRHHGNGFWWEHFLEELHFDDEEGNRNVDLHKGIKQPGIPRYDDIGGILQRSKSVRFLGCELKVPCLTDSYAVLLINFAKALINRQPAISYLMDILVLAKNSERICSDKALAALPQSLKPILKLSIHTASVLFGSVEGSRDWTTRQGVQMADGDLVAAVFPGQFSEADLPRRRELLKHLHAGHAAGYLHEVWNLASSEILRRSSHS